MMGTGHYEIARRILWVVAICGQRWYNLIFIILVYTGTWQMMAYLSLGRKMEVCSVHLRPCIEVAA